MCGRFSLTSPIEAMRQLFNFNERPNLSLAYNIAPTTKIAAIRRGTIPHTKKTQLFMPQWGLIPSWEKTAGNAAKLINARSETVNTKPSFREAFKAKRCLIPCNGFYEWKIQEDGSKQPYFIYASVGGLFAFAGLWEQWVSPEKDIIESCTILTMPATDSISEIHHRMPVSLLPEHYDEWLQEDPSMSIPHPTEQVAFSHHPVSKKVGNVRNNDADLQQEVELPIIHTQSSLF
ncbi:MAG: SOS response-associated peptidase [Sneathiella sp.]|nr:SOS response-associated peptidase [Sneathiella sp.]